MKRLAALTLEDLVQCPIWLYDGESDNDAYVTQSPNANITEEVGFGPTYIALTEFVLANGDRHLGYTSPADPSGLDYLQPVIVFGDRRVALWTEEGRIFDVPKQLELEEHDVYPIAWRSVVPVDGNVAEGLIQKPQ